MKTACFLAFLFAGLLPLRAQHQLPYIWTQPPSMQVPEQPTGADLYKAKVKEAAFYRMQNGKEVRDMHYRFPGKDTLWVLTTDRNLVTRVYRDGLDSCVWTATWPGQGMLTRYRKQGGAWLITEEVNYPNEKTISRRLQYKDSVVQLRRERFFYDARDKRLRGHGITEYYADGKQVKLEIDSTYSETLRKMICTKYYLFYPGNSGACADCRKWNMEGKQVFERMDQHPAFVIGPPVQISGFNYAYQKGSAPVTPNTAKPQFNEAPAPDMMGDPVQITTIPAFTPGSRPAYLNEVSQQSGGKWVFSDSVQTEMKDDRPFRSVEYHPEGRYTREFFYDADMNLVAVLFTDFSGKKSWERLRFTEANGTVFMWVRQLPASIFVEDEASIVTVSPSAKAGDTYNLYGLRQQLNALAEKLPQGAKVVAALRQPVDAAAHQTSHTDVYSKPGRDSVVSWERGKKNEREISHVIRVYNDTFEQQWQWYTENGSTAKPDTSYSYYFKIPGSKQGLLREQVEIKYSSDPYRREYFQQERTLRSYNSRGMMEWEQTWDTPFRSREWRPGSKTEITYTYLEDKDTFVCTEERIYRRNSEDKLSNRSVYKAEYYEDAQWKSASNFIWGVAVADTLFYERMTCLDQLQPGNTRLVRVEHFKKEHNKAVSVKTVEWRALLDEKGRILELKEVRDGKASHLGYEVLEWDKASGLPGSRTKVYADGTKSLQWRGEYKR